RARHAYAAAPPLRMCALSRHDALPIYNEDGLYAFPAISDGQYDIVVNALAFEERRLDVAVAPGELKSVTIAMRAATAGGEGEGRSEEHTSALQSRENVVCRLVLAKKTA